jgi:hypothetical protein
MFLLAIRNINRNRRETREPRVTIKDPGRRRVTVFDWFNKSMLFIWKNRRRRNDPSSISTSSSPSPKQSPPRSIQQLSISKSLPLSIRFNISAIPANLSPSLPLLQPSLPPLPLTTDHLYIQTPSLHPLPLPLLKQPRSWWLSSSLLLSRLPLLSPIPLSRPLL